MLHGEDDGMDDGLEHLTLKLEHTLSAMVDDIVNELEEGFSEFGVANEVIRDHLKGWLAKADEDLGKESGQVFSLLIENRSKEHHGLWITRIGI